MLDGPVLWCDETFACLLEQDDVLWQTRAPSPAKALLLVTINKETANHAFYHRRWPGLPFTMAKSRDIRKKGLHDPMGCAWTTARNLLANCTISDFVLLIVLPLAHSGASCVALEGIANACITSLVIEHRQANIVAMGASCLLAVMQRGTRIHSVGGRANS